MQSKQLLNEVVSVLILNLHEECDAFVRRQSDVIIDPKPGIYLLNNCEPLLTGDKHFYTKKGLETNTPLLSLDGLKENIYDEDGVVVISKFIMHNQQKYLRTKPNLPVVAMDVAQLVAEEYVDSMLPYTEAQDFMSRFKELYRPEAHHLVDQDAIEIHFRRMIRKLALFVGADVYNIYNFKRVGVDLYVEKGVDFRIYDWTVMKENQALEQSED